MSSTKHKGPLVLAGVNSNGSGVNVWVCVFCWAWKLYNVHITHEDTPISIKYSVDKSKNYFDIII